VKTEMLKKMMQVVDNVRNLSRESYNEMMNLINFWASLLLASVKRKVVLLEQWMVQKKTFFFKALIELCRFPLRVVF